MPQLTVCGIGRCGLNPRLADCSIGVRDMGDPISTTQVPRKGWLLDWEKRAVLDYQRNHPKEGHGRLTLMTLDAGIVAVSPNSVYRVLKDADRLSEQARKHATKGKGFIQPKQAHEH